MKYIKTSSEYLTEKTTIGLNPVIGISNFDCVCKSDTGAKTCSIHGEFDEKESKLKFNKHSGWEIDDIELEISDFYEKEVTSSNGESEKRYFVKIPIKYNDTEHKVEFSITNRKDMEYPILLGRNFLKDYIIDLDK